MRRVRTFGLTTLATARQHGPVLRTAMPGGDEGVVDRPLAISSSRA